MNLKRKSYSTIESHNTYTQSDTTMFYDANGNLALLQECEKDFTRFHDWDDENRLRMVVGNNRAQAITATMPTENVSIS